jgi:spore maturation protein CgeB
MLTVLYSFGKTGDEGRYWEQELADASNERVRFVPFNHREALDGVVYSQAVELDRDYRTGHPRLLRLHERLAAAIEQSGARCLFVTQDQVYHPDHLLKLPLYRAYYTTDDPGSTYIRTIPYIHAFHHILHCAIPYSREKTLRAKLLECGARAVDFLPLGVFDYEFDPSATEDTILAKPRDIDLIYIGNAFFAQKFQGFLELVRAFGDRLQIYGFWKAKHSLYLSVHARRRVWVRSVSLSERVRLYQRAKIGFNMHWDKWGLGNQRLYHLPANGVMQICDSPEHLGEVFESGREVVPARDFGEMVDRARHYLAHDEERCGLALAGFRRARRDYRISTVTQRLGEMLLQGMAAQGFRP